MLFLLEHFSLEDLVLILVVMEEGQRHVLSLVPFFMVLHCLNPCCNGRGSKTKLFLALLDKKTVS